MIVKKNEPVQVRESGFTLTIKAAEGGGFAQTQDELMYQPPGNGYQSETKITVPPGGEIRITQNLRLYLKTPDGKYAAIQLRVTQYNQPLAGMNALIYYNPRADQKNLEYDGYHQLYLSH